MSFLHLICCGEAVSTTVPPFSLFIITLIRQNVHLDCCRCCCCHDDVAANSGISCGFARPSFSPALRGRKAQI